MNIWALNKDAPIKRLLLKLVQDMGEDSFMLIDMTGMDKKAIRIGSHRTTATAYIYTYAQGENRYGLHLEYPRDEGGTNSVYEEVFENLRYRRLLEALRDHLECYVP